MQDEFLTLTKALKIPLLNADDVAALNRLQKQWEHWSQRERQHAALRIAEDQQAAFDAFLDNPTAESAQRMLVLADANLTGTRYAMLRRACTALRGRISAQAAKIIRPTLDRVLEALRAEHARRRETAEPVMSSNDRNPVVVDARKAVEYAEGIGNRLLWASDGKSDKQPVVLADVLMSGANDLTSNAGK